jgi:deoxyribodipyrimidine photolyase-related protein
MNRAAIIYPHQLFEEHPALNDVSLTVLVEEPLYFSQYRFHRQKLIFHRATMKRYAQYLLRRKRKVLYLEAGELADTGDVANKLQRLKIRKVRYVDPCDDWLSTRLAAALERVGIQREVLDDPHFLTPTSVVQEFHASHSRLFFTQFYIEQRKRLGILLETDFRPAGGQWTYDRDNRRKLPKGVRVPSLKTPREDEDVREAREYVRARFPDAIGSDAGFQYPTDHAGAADWLEDFVRERLALFGDYEDAISANSSVLFHSVLTPMLNVGLLSPRRVVEAVLRKNDEVPLNSLEGFIRQVIGWREFVRLVYLVRGRRQRTRNFWGLTRKLPAAFYDGTTGIAPVDAVIHRVLETGYCHHIERLMILGNFLLLCDIAPDDVHQWFMELFVDAYDWVMTPNVYGMSQYADGGLMTTKPYISGSSYVLKMSDFQRGPWCAVWDALYWRFVHRRADFFRANPRMAMMVKLKDKLGAKLHEHLRVADEFLSRLHGS